MKSKEQDIDMDRLVRTALNDPQEMARMMDLQTGTEYVVCFVRSIELLFETRWYRGQIDMRL